MTKYHITPFIEGSWSQFVVLQKQEGGSFVDTPVLAAGDIVPDDFAAQFYVNPVTAYVMMFEVLKIEAGKWLIQSASGSTLGRIVIQLAK
jgi:NADPH2:quinone reductase